MEGKGGGGGGGCPRCPRPPAPLGGEHVLVPRRALLVYALFKPATPGDPPRTSPGLRTVRRTATDGEVAGPALTRGPVPWPRPLAPKPATASRQQCPRRPVFLALREAP